MSDSQDKKKVFQPNLDKPSDVYYECVTSCSLNNQGLDCLTECVATYFQEVVES